MFYDLKPTLLNPTFRTEMCQAWYDVPASMLDFDNIWCGFYFE